MLKNNKNGQNGSEYKTAGLKTARLRTVELLDCWTED